MEKEEAKYAASKARAEARKARKKSIMDKLIDSKKEKASEPVKITLEGRLKRCNPEQVRHFHNYPQKMNSLRLSTHYATH